MTESSEGNEVSATLTSVTTARNRLMSWGNTAKDPTKTFVVVASYKIPMIGPLLGFVSNITKWILAALISLPYTLLKFVYVIAKLFTRGLSSIRRFLPSAK